MLGQACGCFDQKNTAEVTLSQVPLCLSWNPASILWGSLSLDTCQGPSERELRPLVATQAECSADGWLWEGADLRVTLFPVKPSQQTLHAARMTCPSLNPLAVVQSLICVWRFVIPWTEAHQASLSFTISRSLLKLMSTESVMPSNHLILCHPLLLPPSIFPSIMVFSSESALCFRGPNIGALASASVLPMNIKG